MQPFTVVIGVQTATLVAYVAYRAAASLIPLRAEQATFCVVSFFFVLSAFAKSSPLLEIWLRTTVAAVEEREEEQRVRRLHGK